MRGHTLIEMLAVLAIASLLFAVALPSFGALLADHRRVSAVNGIVTALHHARSASITATRPARVCPAGASGRCGADWAAGWFAFVEPAGWKAGRPVPPDAVLYRFGPPHAALAVASNRTAYRFRPYRARATNGTVVVCAPGRPGRAVVVAPSGRVRTTAEVPGWAAAACA